MDKFNRLKATLVAAVGIPLGILVASLVGNAQHRADMAAVFAESPEYGPLISKLCADCDIPREFVFAGEYTHANGRKTDNVCRLIDGAWMFYGTDADGNGVGGDQPCPIDPLTAPALPSVGPSPGWSKRVRKMLERNNDDEIKEFVGRKLNARTEVP